MTDSITLTIDQTITLRDGRTVLLRHARPDDAAAVCAIQAQIYEEGVSNTDDTVETVEERTEEFATATSDTLYLVGEYNGEVVGSIELHRSPFRFLRHHALLAINLHRDFRGGGLGSALIRRATDWARHEGLEMIRLDVLDSNPRAKALYERLGFEPYGYFPDFAKHADGTYVGSTLMLLRL